MARLGTTRPVGRMEQGHQPIPDDGLIQLGAARLAGAEVQGESPGP